MKQIFTILLLSSLFSAHAQYYNQTPEFLKANSQWAFGSGTGLEFTSGTALPWQTSVTGREGYATISDPNTGDLLFYSNGGSVWNKSHQIMPNGINLMGNPYVRAYSTIQGALIVPFISGKDDKENQKTTKYYLFSLAWQGGVRTDPQTGNKGSLFYNVVDMDLDNGNGDVDTNYKNIVLDSLPLSESLIAIPGCNNDIWILTHSYYTEQPQIYKVYHITENGLNPIPAVFQSKADGNIGSIAVSSDRQKIAFANSFSNIELSDFDPYSGSILNSMLIGSAGTDPYYASAAFSPDNTKLYATTSLFFIGELVQYDISIFDSTAIDLSKETIAMESVGFGVIRLYNDTIYVSDFWNTSSVHRINQPNILGAACDFQQNAIVLSAQNGGAALGSDVVFAIKSDSLYSLLDTLVCKGDEGVFLKALDSSYSNYTWNTGDTTSSIKVNNQGTYWVSYFECNKYYRDSFIIRENDLYTAITVDGYQLGTSGGPFASYQWYFNGQEIPGATSPTITVTQNGDYRVEVADEYGCVFMSDIYKVNNVNIRDLQQLAGAIRIYPNPAVDKINIDAPLAVKYVLTSIDGKELIKGNNSSPVNIGFLAQGIYFLTVAGMEGQVLKTEKIIKLP